MRQYGADSSRTVPVDVQERLSDAPVQLARLPRVAPAVRRQQILDVATEVFDEEGYGAASMSSISARLGGSKATLYKYFPTKDEIFLQILAIFSDRFRKEISFEEFDAHDFMGFLIDFGLKYLNVMMNYDTVRLFRIIQRDGRKFPEIAHALFRSESDLVGDRLAITIAHYRMAGDVVCDKPRRAATQYLAMLRGDIHSRVVLGISANPDRFWIEEHVRDVAGTFADGLLRRP
jgi:TetR/AcrR family transcriptional regulator, mexJK operon transcriptional repressor